MKENQKSKPEENITIKHRDWAFRDSPDFPLLVRFETQQADTVLHLHEFVELVVILNGSGLHETLSESVRLRAGDVFAIPPGMKHRYGIEATEKLQLYNLLFDPTALSLPFQDFGQNTFLAEVLQPWDKQKSYPRLSLSDDALADLHPLLVELHRESTATRPGFRSFRLGLLLIMLGKLARFHNHATEKNSYLDKRIMHVVKYLNSHCLESVEISNLPLMAGMSRSAFFRAFFLNTGDTPLQYVLKQRINYACRELQETDHPIAETAFSCGFTDHNYFSRTFRRLIGISPRDFRRRARETRT